ncbi:uncharacterized protein TNCV_3237251 [Trichonephila clavipes]|nr:uncharacterized protein TNCV_3237251 [Trichonephila clavipes]
MRCGYRNLDGNRCKSLSGFQMLNDDEILTPVQAESNPVDDETDEDEDNSEIRKGPSNAGAFSALETAMEWSEPQSGCCPLNHYCSRESESLLRKNEGVQ